MSALIPLTAIRQGALCSQTRTFNILKYTILNRDPVMEWWNREHLVPRRDTCTIFNRNAFLMGIHTS